MESFKLNWGLWMEATPYAVEKGILFEHQRGILLEEWGNSLVRIVREGLVTPGWYARVFWQPLDEEKREEDWKKERS
ncbi:MAG: hypothetical protein V3W19_09995 [Desulfatiglandales bacterium]